MCGIAGILGQSWQRADLTAMVNIQRHRGPDADGIYISEDQKIGLGHNRLSIIDLSDAGRQPMVDASGTKQIVFNGEIYNYLELRQQLSGEYNFQTRTDTEVILAAYEKWGEECLEHFIGMFAFIIWDESEQTAFAARDRFGVKPLYYHYRQDKTLFIASEIKALHAAGISRVVNEETWATYLTYGLYDHSEETFWSEIYSLPGGYKLIWRPGQMTISNWYDLKTRVGDEIDYRSDGEVQEEYFALMKESVNFRFRADVPIGINLSGGLDSSALLGLVHEIQGPNSEVKAFTFTTGDERYDELPWVRQMLEKTRHPLIISRLAPECVPELAGSIQYYQDEPFGGIPTLAYARLFEKARANGVLVLLDGNGMDEQWAGYDYYQSAANKNSPAVIQGTKEKPTRPECLTDDFRALAKPPEFPNAFVEKIRNIQYRDAKFTKIPRAMRFNDRISMRSSTELREPFLDHRLFELALRQPFERKIGADGTRKKMLRKISRNMLPEKLSETPKRPLQTPQREWLRGELKAWADERISDVLSSYSGSWFDKTAVLEIWQNYCRGESDNSFYIWQWINLGLMQSVTQKQTTAFAEN